MWKAKQLGKEEENKREQEEEWKLEERCNPIKSMDKMPSTFCFSGCGTLFWHKDQILSLEVAKSAIGGNSNSEVFYSFIWCHSSFKVQDEVYNYTPRPESQFNKIERKLFPVYADLVVEKEIKNVL